jgi:hypothetical protein
MTNILQLADIPDDLAAEVAKLPDFPARLIGFLRTEVSRHRQDQRPFGAQAKEIVKQAREEADRLAASGMTPDQARTEFTDLYLKVMPRIW